MDYLDISLQLTEEDISLRNAAREFAQEVMRPIAKELDLMSPEEVIAEGSPMWTFLKKAYELGYHKVLISDAYGGLGVTPFQIHLIYEELAWASWGLTVLLGVCAFPFFAACLTNNDELIDNFVKPFCDCTDASIRGCWAITEPDHGSDYICTESFSNDPKIRNNVQARLEGNEWVINGQKSSWVSGGTIATHALLFCQIDPSLGMAGGGICVCQLNEGGVTRGKPLRKMGQRDLNQGEIFFDNFRVPRDYMFCEPEAYPAMLEMILAAANAAMGIFATGCARAAFEEALVYAKERVQGGLPIIQHRSVRQRLFDMFAKTEACRALSRAAVNLNFNISPALAEYSLASKTRCTQMAFEVAHEAVQILGGNGLTQEYHTEKLFRDARAALIEDGNNEALAAGGGQIIADTYPRSEDEVC